MKTILAAVDASAAAQPVLETATALGRTLRMPVVAIHVRQDGAEVERLLTERAGIELRLATGIPAEAIVAGLTDADVALAVLGARGHPAGRRPAGSTALAVATHAAKPVVVVPPDPRDPPPVGLHRVLVPLDGTADTARAVEQTMGWFAGSGVEIVSLHVFHAATVPRFWDRPEHDHGAWTREFLARNAPAAGTRLQVRSGWPSDRVLEVARAEGADMIALGWGRRLAPDRAAVVREVLTRSPVPVILLPRPARGPPGPGTAGRSAGAAAAQMTEAQQEAPRPPRRDPGGDIDDHNGVQPDQPRGPARHGRRGDDRRGGGA